MKFYVGLGFIIGSAVGFCEFQLKSSVVIFWVGFLLVWLGLLGDNK